MAVALDIIGKVLDKKYLIQKILGQGGMGAVFQATHIGTRRPVALKIIMPRFMNEVEFIERFKREARASGQLIHPHVVNVTDFGFAAIGEEQVAYLVMEYLNGQTLAELMADHPKLPVKTTVEIVEQVCLAIQVAHQQGIVHRDLKPENIFLQDNGRGGFLVKVLDFGIAKLNERESASSSEPDPHTLETISLADKALAREMIEKMSQQTEVLVGQVETATPYLMEMTQYRGSLAPNETLMRGADNPLQSEVQQTGQFASPETSAPAEPTLVRVSGQNKGPALPGTGQIRNQAGPGLSQAPSASGNTVDLSSKIFTPHQSVTEQTLNLSTEAPIQEPTTLKFPESDAIEIGSVDTPSRHVGSTPLPAVPQSVVIQKETELVTFAGTVLGTPMYMSPEQCRGIAIDHRSDLYSLGVIVYRMLTGEPPFTGNFSYLMKQHIDDEPPHPCEKNPELSAAVADVVLSTLQKNPAQRPPSAEAFATALRANAEGEDPIFEQAGSVYRTHFFSFVSISLMVHAPYAVLNAILFFAWLVVSQTVFPRPLERLQFFYSWSWIITAALVFFAGVVNLAVFQPAVNSLQCIPDYRVSIAQTVSNFFTLLPKLVLTSFVCAGTIVKGLLIGIQCGIRMITCTALFAPIVSSEGLSVGAALDRSTVLVNRFRPAMVAIQVRYLVLGIFAILLAPISFAMLGILISLVGDVSIEIVVARGAWLASSVVVPVVFAFCPWVVISLIEPFLATAAAILYTKLRQIGAEPIETLMDTEEAALAETQRISTFRKPVFLATLGLVVLIFSWMVVRDRLIIYAAGSDMGILVEALMVVGANPNARVKPQVNHEYETTPLLEAIDKNDKPTVTLLLDAGVEVNLGNKYGWTPLMQVVQDENDELVQEFLNRGANVNAQHNFGGTALMEAANRSNIDLVELLLKYKANPNLANTDGRTALMISIDRGNLYVARLLMDSGARLDIVDNDGWTPFLLSIDRGDPLMARLFIDHGVDVNQKDPDGRTALHIAASRGYAGVVRELIAAGANPEIQFDGKTALHLAQERNRKAVVQILTEKRK
ncbi:MAG: ankyrin repeat domain-containing protein [Acidobacteria bacterium]|nr:ankyrin repeat domain-containing protein [Acidobacteriota bacterium]